MEVRRDSRVGPSPVVTGVFRVYDVDERPKLRGTSYVVLILAAGAEHYTAIAGPEAARISRGDSIRVRGCVLFRGCRHVLVAGSLHPLICGGQKLTNCIAVEERSRDSSEGRLPICERIIGG